MLCPTMKTVTVRTNQGELEATLVRENAKTIWVRLPDGNEIKRHKAKHLVCQK